MEHLKITTNETGGTSFHDVTVSTTINKLKTILGEPDFDDNYGDDKVNMEWNRKTSKGNVFTVYDWKEYRVIKPDEIIQWHIGGKNQPETREALNEILEALHLSK